MKAIYAVLFLGVLVAIYILAYIQNKKTPLPEGCQDLKAECDGCKLYSCDLHPNHKEGK